MPQFDTEIVCLVTVDEKSNGDKVYGAVAPDAMYSITPTESLPEQWEYIADTISKESGCDVLGAIVRTVIPDAPTEQGGEA